MHSSRSHLKRARSGSTVFGRPGLLAVAPAGCGDLDFVASDRADVASQLPDLLAGHLVAKGRHTVRATVADRGNDRDHLGPIEPPSVLKRRAYVSPAVTVA